MAVVLTKVTVSSPTALGTETNRAEPRQVEHNRRLDPLEVSMWLFLTCVRERLFRRGFASFCCDCCHGDIVSSSWLQVGNVGFVVSDIFNKCPRVAERLNHVFVIVAGLLRVRPLHCHRHGVMRAGDKVPHRVGH